MGSGENATLTLSVRAPARVDDGILDVTIEIVAGGFAGKYNAYIFERELIDLRNELKRIYKNLRGRTKFETSEYIVPEKPLEFEIIGNGRGQFDVAGVARHENNRLVFDLEFDQSYIPAMMRELDEIIGCP